MTYATIGQRIKQRRLEMGLSGRELARRTGLSASFVSQVERGKTRISLESLRLVAETLDVSLLHFLAEEPPSSDAPPSEAPAAKPQRYEAVVRAGGRPQLTFPDSGVTYELLTRDLSRQMEALCGRLAPGTGNVARRLRAPTEEFIYVLSGALTVGLTSGAYRLNPGDAIYFEGHELEQLACAAEDEEAVWISVITPPAF
jgi:transcriptional regulator with XRE-family HTH domain